MTSRVVQTASGDRASHLLRAARIRWQHLRGANLRLPTSIIIVDDFYPNPLSGFRLAEFGALQAACRDIQVVTSYPYQCADSDQGGRPGSEWGTSPQTHHVSSLTKVGPARGYYGVFLANAVKISQLASKYRAPFAFTLYPGGGFSLHDPRALRLLDRIFGSPWLRNVIVTQPVVHDYLAHEFPTLSDRIVYSFGVPTWSALSDPRPLRKSRGKGSGPLRVAFVGHRGHRLGHDKGIDSALAAARILRGRGVHFTWDFIGEWGDLSVEYQDVPEVRFRGALNQYQLVNILQQCDIAVFPNRSGTLGPGHFDGFPVTSAVEAALNGCAIAMTNPLDQKTPLQPGLDYFDIRSCGEEIAELLARLAVDSDGLFVAQTQHEHRWREIFAIDVLLKPRLEVVSRLRHSPDTQ